MRNKKILFFIFVFVSSIFAQAPNLKWIKSIELPDQSVYLDTSSIKLLENQISVLSLTIFREPQFIKSLNKKAASFKSQILFYVIPKTYTVIGNLYYDKTFKILGESSSQTFAMNNVTNASSIDSDKVMTAIFEKSTDYLNSKGLTLRESKNTFIGEVKNDSNNLVDNKTLADKSIEKKPTETLTPPISSKNTPFTKSTITKPPTDINKKVEYDLAKESNLNNSMIFTDGQKYCFQASSWKNRRKAESEVQKLQGKGHNAFVVEAYLRQKGGTWYRVRIGYFNSFQETTEYMKRMR